MIASAHDFTYQFAWIRDGAARDQMLESNGNMTNNSLNVNSTTDY